MNEITQNTVPESPELIAHRLMERVEYRDGLNEIAIGVLILVFGGAILLQMSFGMKAMWFVLLMIPIGHGLQWTIKKVRKQYLIGKIGYVKLKPINRKRVAIAMGKGMARGMFVAALWVFVIFVALKMLIAPHNKSDILSVFSSWMLSVSGILYGALMAFYGRLPRYIIGGVIMTLMGILLAFSRISVIVSFAIFYGFAGLLPIISGSVVFLLLLRQTAEPGE
jgi:hypothetical protein